MMRDGKAGTAPGDWMCPSQQCRRARVLPLLGAPAGSARPSRRRRERERARRRRSRLQRAAGRLDVPVVQQQQLRVAHRVLPLLDTEARPRPRTGKLERGRRRLELRQPAGRLGVPVVPVQRVWHAVGVLPLLDAAARQRVPGGRRYGARAGPVGLAPAPALRRLPGRRARARRSGRKRRRRCRRRRARARDSMVEDGEVVAGPTRRRRRQLRTTTVCPLTCCTAPRRARASAPTARGAT